MSVSRHSLRWIVITGSIVATLLIVPIIVLVSMFVFRDNPGAKSNPSVRLLSARLPGCINLTLPEKLQSVFHRQVRTTEPLLP